MGHKNCREFIQSFGILIVESSDCGTIKIEHAEESLAVEQWHHDLRIRSDIAGYVSFKLVDVWYDDGLALLGRHSANAFPHWNADTRGIPLEWSKHQLVALQKVETG